jgi:hypothetical protein
MTVTADTVILRWRSLNQVKIIFIDFSIIKDCFSLVFVFSGVLLCIELVYTVALSSYNLDKEKSTVLKYAEMRVTVNKDAR